MTDPTTRRHESQVPITALTAVRGPNGRGRVPTLTKTFFGEDYESLTYDLATWFSIQSVMIETGLDGLHRAVRYYADRPHSCWIRGESVDFHKYRKRTLRRLSSSADSPATFKAKGRSWLMLDFDDPYSPAKTDRDFAEYLRSLLPPVFRTAGCVVQLGSSHGIPKESGGVKRSAHLYFLLQWVATDDQLRVYFRSLVNGMGSASGIYSNIVDLVTFNPVQIHYTASPIFRRGAVDPVTERIFTLDGDERVDIPEEDFWRARNLVAFIPQGGNYAGMSVDEILTKMGDDGDGFEEVILHAVGRAVLVDGPNLHVADLKETIRAAIHSAHARPGRERDLRRYSSDRFLNDKIRRTMAKFKETQ